VTFHTGTVVDVLWHATLTYTAVRRFALPFFVCRASRATFNNTTYNPTLVPYGCYLLCRAGFSVKKSFEHVYEYKLDIYTVK